MFVARKVNGCRWRWSGAWSMYEFGHDHQLLDKSHPPPTVTSLDADLSGFSEACRAP